jgi:hypothetical protein
MDSSALVETTGDDINILPQMITAWKAVKAESIQLQQQTREKKLRQKALEEVIMRTMKKHNVGQLDLKASNSRLSCATKETKGSLSQKNLESYLGEYMKSSDEAKKAIAFIDEKRGRNKKDVLSFENL